MVCKPDGASLLTNVAAYMHIEDKVFSHLAALPLNQSPQPIATCYQLVSMYGERIALRFRQCTWICRQTHAGIVGTYYTYNINSLKFTEIH